LSGVMCCKESRAPLGSSFSDDKLVSLISIRSSSMLASRESSPGPSILVSPSFDHSPVGSTVTCSTAEDVERSISSTYLHELDKESNSHCRCGSGEEDCLLVNL